MDCAPVLGAHSYAVFNQDLFKSIAEAQKSNPKNHPPKKTASGTVCLGSKQWGQWGDRVFPGFDGEEGEDGPLSLEMDLYHWGWIVSDGFRIILGHPKR